MFALNIEPILLTKINIGSRRIISLRFSIGPKIALAPFRPGFGCKLFFGKINFYGDLKC